MKNLTLLLPLLFVVLTTGCVRGPVIKIVTEEPADDFVVVCNWSSNLSLHGTGSSTGKDVRVVKSGEVVDCGRSLISRGYASIMHPVYVLAQNHESEIEDGVSIIKPITKLQKIDEQKAKFESGYWDKYRNPEREYAQNLHAGCGFSAHYIEYYSKVKQVDVEYFKRIYHEIMLECFKRSFSVTKSYNPIIGDQLPTADEWMTRWWNSNEWKIINE